jgi:hypothetical protein
MFAQRGRYSPRCELLKLIDKGFFKPNEIGERLIDLAPDVIVSVRRICE